MGFPLPKGLEELKAAVPGTLYVVATPIGNLDDLSSRALATLRGVAWIACEDTRRTARLLARHGIQARTFSYHRFNERARLEDVLVLLRDGADVALVSDGGTPGISDPGSELVGAAASEGLPVVPIPGPSAVVALLSVSGVGADRFVFDGFLPHRPGERRRRLRELRDERRAVVLFETPHRIVQTLEDCTEILGARPLVLGREMTKRNETILRGTADDLKRILADREVKGEIVLVLAPFDPSQAPGAEETSKRVLEEWEAALRAHAGDSRGALRAAARALGMKRSELYRRLAELGRMDAQAP